MTATEPRTATVLPVQTGGLWTVRGFYDGTPSRGLVPCPDCHRPADAMFRDHAGTCTPGRAA